MENGELHGMVHSQGIHPLDHIPSHCRDIMNSQQMKGDDLFEGSPIKMSWYMPREVDEVKSNPDCLLSDHVLYVCYTDKPPNKLNTG